jgi:uncharacterized membrane protein
VFSLLLLSYHFEGLEKWWLRVKREDFKREGNIFTLEIKKDQRKSFEGEEEKWTKLGLFLYFTLELTSN